MGLFPPKFLAVFIFLFAQSASALALEFGDPEEKNWVFLGANLGYTTVSPSSTIRESSRDGYAFHLKLLGSHYWNEWVADLGVGYQHHFASGRDDYRPSSDAQVKVKTRSGFIELSPRYRWDKHWQFGAVLNGFFGTDVSYGESILSDSSFALAGGVRMNWETEGERYRWRFGAQALRDLNVKDHAVWWVMADVQFGIPIRYSTSAQKKPEPTPARVDRPQAPQFAEVTSEKGVKIYLGEAVLRFKTASAELRPSSRAILLRVTRYLKDAPKAWKKMRVEGHADKRGKLDYNIKLSRRRAETVFSELVRLGIHEKQLSVEGYGPTRPIDPAEDLEAYALNRRVELWIDGVNDAEAIVRDLNELK